MENPSNGGLPTDIIQEILLRLPVKTLLRFKCVCKQWYTLIASQSFVNQYFCHESNQEKLLIPRYRANEGGYTYALYVDDMCTEYEEPDHLQMPATVSALLGPLNGVFCMVSESEHIALLNPAMRQFKPLPSHYVDVQPFSSVYDYVLGFGLDPLSGDYKLVSIQYFWDEKRNVTIYPPLVSVYNSPSDSWRNFKGVDLNDSMCCPDWPTCNMHLNGVYYWLVELNDINDVAILAFNMSSEKFRDIQVPDCVKSEERYVELALYGDSIALLSYDDVDKIDKCMEIWVMKKEGCWCKSFSVGSLEYIGWPLGFWKNNELLLETQTSLLALYNVSTQKLTTTKARVEEISDCWVFSYKDSLVSIKGEGGNCKFWDTSSDFVNDFFK